MPYASSVGLAPSPAREHRFPAHKGRLSAREGRWPRAGLTVGVAALLLLVGVGGSTVRMAPAAASASAAPSPSARWIWTPTSGTNQWVAFRKVITLGAAPTSAVTDIAVDSKYWLWINGSLVTFEGGLKRGPNPTDTYYDEKDLAPYLTSGQNTIAILAQYFGKDGFSSKSSGQGGLLFSSTIVAGGTTSAVVSDSSWRATAHPGYQNTTTGAQPNYRLAESNVYYDARNATAMTNWSAPGFADSSWPTATDKGGAGAAPWNALAPRPIPAFRFGPLTAYANAGTLPTQGTGATITAKLPSNLQVTPYLKVNAPAGAVIGIQTDHYTDGGENNVRSTYVTTAGVQEFESLGWMSGTAVQYTIPSNVSILGLSYRESGYDTNVAGSFTSSDPFFNTLWQKAARTMYLNMRDNYMDCPTRERAQWWGDAVNEIKEGFYTFDTRSYAMGKKAISQLVSWHKPNGALYSPIPGNWSSELPTQMLASVWSFWTYYTYTGDAGAVTGAYPAVRAYLNLYALDADGLIAHRAGDWDWEDWGSNIDARVLDNAWYYLALGTAVQLAQLTGNSGDVAGWQAKRNSIAANFNRVLWNAANKEYRSPGYSGDTDDRGNALAVVAGLADVANYPAITTVLSNHRNASPYLEFYVLESLYQMNAASTAESRMKSRYAEQVADPGYTLWEMWSKGGGGTDNHAWNGGPLYALSAYATGVKPTQPGYAAYQVVPQLGSLTTINTTVPTIRGAVNVAINRVAPNHLTMAVTSPAATSARVGVPNFAMTGITIKANGTTVYSGGAATGAVSGLTFAGSDAGYTYFTVAPGSWSFDETGTGGTSAGNVAAGKPVTSNNSLENGDWGVSRLTDGYTTSVAGAKGYTSNEITSPNASTAPMWIEVDLGADTPIDTVRLMPRTDTLAASGGTANFPVDFTIQTRASGAGSYSTVRAVTGQANPNGAAQSYGLRPTTARYVRVQVTTLGAPAVDEPTRYRFQLAELQLPVAGQTVTAGNPLINGDWNPAFAFDGVTTSAAGAKGYTSTDVTGSDVSSAPMWLQLDLGVNRSVSSLALFPRTDTAAVGGGSADFPVDFTVQTRPDGGGSWTTVRSVTGQTNPAGAAPNYALTTTSARYVRVLVTRLGTPAADESTRYRLQLAELVVT